MSLGKVIAKNIAANNFGVAAQIVIAFFLSPFLVHTLGDTRYGIWSVIAALSGYMSLLDFGIASALTRFIARYHESGERDKINKVISSSLFIFVMIAMMLIVLSPFTAELVVSLLSFDESFKKILHTLIIVVSFDMALYVIAGIFRGAYGGFQRFEILYIARVISMLFKALAFYLFLSNGYGLVAMGVIALLSNILLLVYYTVLLKRYFSFVDINYANVNKSDMGMVIQYSKFVFLSMIASQLLNYSSSFVIGYYISAAAITWFSIPWSLTEYVKQFCLAMSRTYIPVFSQLETAGEFDLLYKHYIGGTRYILILSNLLCTGMIIFGTVFISLWMGEKYALKAYYLVYIMFGSLYFISPHLIGYALLQGISKHKWYAYMNVGVSFTSLFLGILLVKPYGIEGVALGMAIPQIIFCGIILPIYIARLLKQSVFSYYYKTYFSLLIPMLVLALSLVGFRLIAYPESYLLLISEALFATFIYLWVLYAISLSNEEKISVNKGIKKLKLRLFKKVKV